MPAEPRVAIIGAGIIGLATAYELVQRGASVVMVDPREPGTGASGGNTGWIVPALSGPIPAPGVLMQGARWMLSQSSSPFRIDFSRPLSLASWLISFWRNCDVARYERGLHALGELNARAGDVFARWRASGLDFELSRDGVLFVAHDKSLVEHIVDDMDKLAGIGYEPVEWVGKPLLHDLEPALGSTIEWGVLAHREQHVRPESLIKALAGHLLHCGVEFVKDEVRSDVEISRDRVVRLSGKHQAVEADAFVLAAGAWTSAVARKFGIHLPVISGKGYSITVDNPALRLSQPLYLADARIACTPFGDTNRFAGLMDLGVEDDTIDSARLSVMISALDRYLPGWNLGTRRSTWAGMRPMTPDGLPVIGKAPGLDNVYVSSGHGMLGMTMAPVSGEIIADMVLKGESRFRTAAFDPGRFSGATVRNLHASPRTTGRRAAR